MSVKILLSSITEFIDSIHNVSTGPSNMIHFSSDFSSKIKLGETKIILILVRGKRWTDNNGGGGGQLSGYKINAHIVYLVKTYIPKPLT